MIKHIVITGSTRGIGLGMARHFLLAGHIVTINGTSETGIEQAMARLKEGLPHAVLSGYAGDVGDRMQTESLWRHAVAASGPVDIWINNAGIDQKRLFLWDIPNEDIRQLLHVNITGMMNGSLTAFRHMQEQGNGFIYNMEGFGSDGMMRDKLSLYGTSKRAVRYFTRSLAKEARHTPICVGTLSPGMVVTDLLRKSLLNDSADAASARKIFNILADDVDTVTSFLVRKMLDNQKNDARIEWLNTARAAWKFMRAPFIRRDLFGETESPTTVSSK